MNDKTRNTGAPEPAGDTALAQMFQQMRSADREQAPAVPTAQQLTARATTPAAHGSFLAPWKMAVAASVVAVTAVLLVPQEPTDPGVLYLDIMSASAMTTDSLLDVSVATLPEMFSLPGVLESASPWLNTGVNN